MAGDRLHAQVDYYTPTDGTDNSSANGLNTVLTGLVSILDGSRAPQVFHGSGGVVSTALNSDNTFASFFTKQGSSVASPNPKAY